MLNDAVVDGVAEAADLDWKAKLPAEKGLPNVEVLIGFEWHGTNPVICHETTPYGRAQKSSTAFGKQFTQVRAVVRLSDSDTAFYNDVRGIAMDCVARFGIDRLSVLLEPRSP